MSLQAKGVVHTVFETKQVNDKFRKRALVVEIADNPKYPQLVLFEATGDRCDALDQVGQGDTVSVDFSLRGREWRSPSGEVKYFTTLDIWKVDVTAKGAPRPEPIVGGSDSDPIPF